MILEEKTPDLLELLIAHVEGNSSVVPVVPWPTTSALTQAAAAEAIEKKKEKGKSN